MRTNSILVTAVVLIFALLTADAVNACTNILVSRGASRDGSVIITYSADGASIPRLILVPGARHKPGTLVNIWGWEDKIIHGQVKQVARTYSVVGLMNEYQVAIGETTTGGRKELEDPKGFLDYDGLMLLALQRSRTAREAIHVIHKLVSEYGYRSHGESLSIADKNEVWLLEIIGKGPEEKGAVWVAARVPEGFITVHANLSRITTFPLDDPENWLYSPDVVDFAVKKGVSDRVVFTGFKDYAELIGVLKSSRVFVLPSSREGFGISVLEANACGLPAVVVKHPNSAAPGLIKDGVNGLTCELTADAIAETIKKVLDKEEEFNAGDEKALLRFDWDEITADIETRIYS